MKALKGALVVLILVLAAAGGIYYYMGLPQPPAVVPTSTSTPVGPTVTSTVAGPTATSTMSTYETSGTRVHKTLGVPPPGPYPPLPPTGALPAETLELTGELRSDGGAYNLEVKALPGYVVALRFASSDLETWAAAHLGQSVTVSGKWDKTDLSVFVVESASVGQGSTGSKPPAHGTLGTPVSGFWSGTHGTDALPAAVPLAATAGSPAEALPNAFSWDGRFGGPNYMTVPVRDQGNCQSCWDFAAVGAMEAQYQINTGNPNTGIHLSEQNVLSCATGDGCQPQYLSVALDWLKTSGTPVEACNAYMATDAAHGASCGTNRCSAYLSATYKITDWTEIPTDAASIKDKLYTHGPVIVVMPVFNDFPWKNAAFWENSIYAHAPAACPDAGPCAWAGHAVVIVGWDDRGSTDYWIVRNSWGPGGGDVNSGYGGYFYMTQDPTTGFFGSSVYDATTGSFKYFVREAAVITDVTAPINPPWQVTIHTDPSSVGSITLGRGFGNLLVRCGFGSLLVDGQTTLVPPKTGTQSVCANAPSGYVFSGWSCGGGLSCSGTSRETNVEISGPGSITATFTRAFSVSFYTTPTSFVGYPAMITVETAYYENYDKGAYPIGDYAAYTEDVPPGYQFHHWEAGPWEIGTSGVYVTDVHSNPTTLQVRGDGWLRAVYSAEVTFHTIPPDKGSISWCREPEGLCTGGKNVEKFFSEIPAEHGQWTMSAIANVPSGWTFSEWKCTGGLKCSGTNTETTVDFTGPGSITATFKQVPVTVIIQPTTILPPLTIPNYPPTISSLTPGLWPDKASPQAVGTTITWTCSASDPDGDPILYEFWLQYGDGPWVITQDWSYENWWSWTPSEAGTYKGGVWVRDGKHQGANWFDDSKEVPYTIVAVPAFDFAVLVSPTSNQVTPGGTATYNIRVILLSGQTQPVNLSVGGLPAMCACATTFTPNAGTPTFTSMLTISTSGNTPAGTYTLTIVATGGGVKRSTTVTFVVQGVPV